MAYKSKLDQQLAARQHYARNPALYKHRAMEQNKVARKRNREFIHNYLRSHPCVDCGESDIDVLDFDHVRGQKRDEVSSLSRQCCGLKTIQAEIEKCDVRCANCHRRVTKRRRKQQATQKKAKRNHAQIKVEVQLNLFVTSPEKW